MGKLILCRGKRTERPYVLQGTGYRIYSIEELCHYIYNNIYSIDETLFTDSLIDWIGTELCLPERAEKGVSLRQGVQTIRPCWQWSYATLTIIRNRKLEASVSCR